MSTKERYHSSLMKAKNEVLSAFVIVEGYWVRDRLLSTEITAGSWIPY